MTRDKYEIILNSSKVYAECLQEQVGEGGTPLRFV